MKEKTNSLSLPERLTIETMPDILNEIKRLWNPGNPLVIDFKAVQRIDSSAIALVNYLEKEYQGTSFINLKPGWQRLFSIFPSSPAPGEKKSPGFSFHSQVERLADQFIHFKNHMVRFLVLFADEIFYTFQYLYQRRGVYPGEILNQLYTIGYNSLGIISIMTFLVGITVSLTSAQQLRLFGADIYLADLVGFGMLRELVPLMSGIILAGKVGASITAEIASMKVLEETDALKTMGIIPEKFLMVPRLLAITLAVPLLVAVADFVGIFAGVLVAQFFLDIPPNMFFTEMFTIVDVGDVLIGLIKTLTFGWLVVVSAGFKGLSVTKGAAGVGIATTESVVLSISLIILADCVYAIILY